MPYALIAPAFQWVHISTMHMVRRAAAGLGPLKGVIQDKGHRGR